MPTLAQNRKAFHNYSIEDEVEAGLVLLGHEVKSIRNGQASLEGAFVSIKNGEAWFRNAYIGKYKHASNLDDYNESRERKLLLKKSEILKLQTRAKEKGYTLVPLQLYTSKHKIKLKIGLGRGKKQFDKRDTIKKKELKRTLDRRLRTRL
jgi:SsrA-binding protein